MMAGRLLANLASFQRNEILQLVPENLVANQMFCEQTCPA